MAERKPTVLYIDDDPGLVRLAQRGLSRFGYAVEGAGTIDEGLARLADGGIDAIALDHFLATGTGLDFLSRLASLEPRPPVVYVTASGEVTVAVEALKAGAADYVPKVVGDDFLVLLRRAIDQAITRSRLEQERAAAEQAVRQARDHAEVLLHEVNHRVANSLSLVAALVRMQANSIEDPQARSAIEQVQARISAIAGVHRRLYTSDNVRSVEMGSYLAALINELAETMHASGIAIRLVMSEEIEVPTDRAVSIGVMVTELVTNAVKYAYPDGAGEVRVRLERAGANELRLSVEDDGVGLATEAAPKGTGVGGRVVAAMARALGSEIAYEGGPGLTASIRFSA
jgi:two-component sensor histidine kinase